MSAARHHFTGNLSAHIGDLDYRRVQAVLETNADGNVIYDTDGNEVHLGKVPVSPDAGGQFDVQAMGSGTGDTIPSEFQYRLVVQYLDPAVESKIEQWTFPWFTLAADMDLAAVGEEYAPPTYETELMGRLDAHEDDLEGDLSAHETSLESGLTTHAATLTTALDTHEAGLEGDLTDLAETLEVDLTGFALAQVAGAVDAADDAMGYRDQAQGYRDQAQTAAALAVDISEIEVPDDVMAAVDSNPASAFRVQQDARKATTLGTETGAPTGYPTAFKANGQNNTIAKIVERDTDPRSAHVEGRGNRAHEWNSHAEGSNCICDGKIAHAEGNGTMCAANDSHAEGNRNAAGRRYYDDVTTGSEDAGSSLGVLQYVLIDDSEGDVTSFFPNQLTDNLVDRYGVGAQKDAKGNIYAAGFTPAVWTGNTPTTPNDLRWALHSICVVRGPQEGSLAYINIAKATYTAGVGTKVYYTGAMPYVSLMGIYSSYAPIVLDGGNGQHAEGLFTSTWGYGAHSEGVETRSWSYAGHAEGRHTRAIGLYAHAEGFETLAHPFAETAHAEGYRTTATGAYGSHSEGVETAATGNAAHAEGSETTASGDYSHAEGNGSTATGPNSHAEGLQTVAGDSGAHAEGSLTTATFTGSHAEGVETDATAYAAHSEGYQTAASGPQSHAEGRQTVASGDTSHAEGGFTTASGNYSHAEGRQTQAIEVHTHAEGLETQATAPQSHAEGYLSQATGQQSHAEGRDTRATGDTSHAEGGFTIASGNYSHAQNRDTTASGDVSTATGRESVASRDSQKSHSAGMRAVKGDNQTTQLHYNRTCSGVGWFDLGIIRTLQNNRTYFFETRVIGRQTGGSAGAVGDSFAYKFTGAFTVNGSGVLTMLGTATRTLIGRTAGMAGDGLTTGTVVSMVTTEYPNGANKDAVLRLDGEANKIFHVSTYSEIAELA